MKPDPKHLPTAADFLDDEADSTPVSDAMLQAIIDCGMSDECRLQLLNDPDITLKTVPNPSPQCPPK